MVTYYLAQWGQLHQRFLEWQHVQQLPAMAHGRAHTDGNPHSRP